MTPDATARLREPPSGDVSGLLSLAAYTTVAIGYLLAVLTTHHLTFGPFLLFTAINLAWLAVFLHLQREETQPGVTLRHRAAMTLLAAAALFCLPLGLGYDWLLPTLTTSVVALVCHWRLTLVVVAAFVVASVGAVALTSGSWGDVASTLVQTTPAYLFAATFSLVLRRQRLLREQAEDLAAEVSRANSELERAHSELRERASQAEELTISRERNRMAREIHDTLGHYLTILALQLETALKLEGRTDPRLHGELVEARRVAAECLAEVRRSVAALRPANLSAISLPEALRRLVAESEALLPKTEIALDVDDGLTPTLPPELRVALYRCAQEALTNVRKHAAASKVLVRLRVDGGADDGVDDGEHIVELTVLDNGSGEQVASASPPSERATGFGLLGMRERIALLGGTVRAGAELGKGWRVEVRVPQETLGPSAMTQPTTPPIANTMPVPQG